MYDSCIIENNAAYSIRQESSGEINVYNTVFDKQKEGNVIVQNEAKATYINTLLFIKTGECYAENIKPITIKSHCYMTCKNRRRIMEGTTMFKLSFLVMMS